MQELSLNLLDVAENSLRAGADQVELTVAYTKRGEETLLDITIADNGRGMDPEAAKRVIDPFYTTRTTRKVGLGVPLFKMAAELTGGGLEVHSTPGSGTTVTAHLVASHIDAMPLGDMAATYVSLVQVRPDVDFLYTYSVTVEGEPPQTAQFTADTRQFREVLEGLPLNTPAVLGFIRSYIEENTAECARLLQDGPSA